MRHEFKPVPRKFRNTELERLAAIRGELEAGKLLRDFGQGALGGGAGGALFGGAPGAAIGAIGGGVGFVGQDLIENWAYGAKSPQEQAAWQAGDLQEKLQKVADAINETNPTIAQYIASLGSSYKEFIDGYVQKKDGINLNSNRFNLDPEHQRQLFMNGFGSIYQGMQKKAADDSLAPPSSPEDAYSLNSTPNDYTGSHVTEIGSAGAAMGFDEGARMLLSPVLKSGPGALGKMSNPAAFVIGIAVNFGVDAAATALEKSAGIVSYVQSYFNDVQQIISQVNQLTSNDPKVRMAGNQIYTYMHWLIQTLTTQQGEAKDALDQYSSQHGGATPPPSQSQMPSGASTGGPGSVMNRLVSEFGT